MKVNQDDVATYFSGPNSKNLRVIFGSPWTAGGSPSVCAKEELLLEPIDTYIISKRVRWRIVKLNYKCPCCGYYTFEHPPMGELDLCPVCCWFDDTECLGDLDFVNASLGVSLRQARKNFILNRACKEAFASEVRPPRETELDGINWILPSMKK